MSREIFAPSTGQRVPIRIWARAPSDETLAQLRRLASMPYVVEHVAAMADAHVSEGVAVGTVFATEHALVPRALGGDLGCGMTAIELGVEADRLDRRTLERTIEQLGRAIPTGASTHRGRGIAVRDALLATPLSTQSLVHGREALARRHLGTLGGGNHFVEIDRDVHGAAWLLVHSGSRGIGAAIAAHHVRAAETAGRRDALAGIEDTTEAGMAYVRDGDWALAFARENRRVIATRAVEVLVQTWRVAIEPVEHVDLHHNFVARERWYGRELWVHRKGAVAAPCGARVLIPGSMGTASYLVEGTGNPESFGSCSHGAGRVLSRKQARSAIGPEALTAAMRRIVFPARLARELVEEAPAAYRDIVEVLEDQSDLLERRLRLEPIAVLKG